MKTIKINSTRPPRPTTGETLAYMGWTLHYTIGSVIAAPVKVGDTVETSKGEGYIVKGGNPPHKASSSGFVHVEQDGASAEYYPQVIGAKWVKDEA